MKPALYYAIHDSSWRTGEIVAVTKTRNARWWGRRPNGDPTNGSGGLRGKFETVEEAERKVEGVRELRMNYRLRRNEIDRQMTALRDEEERAILAYLDAPA